MYVLLERRGDGPEVTILEGQDSDRDLMEKSFFALQKDAKERNLDVTFRLEHFEHCNIDHLQIKGNGGWVTLGEE